MGIISNSKSHNMENAKEISSNDKSTLDISSKLIMGGTQYSNIMSIALLRDCSDGRLADILKKNHCQFVTTGNDMYIIFNKPARAIAKLAGRSGVPSFIYCHANTSEVWRMKNEDFKYNSVKNPYIFDGDAEVTLSDTLLRCADKAIGKAVDVVRKAFHLTGESDDNILDYIYNRTGMKAGACRECFTDALNQQPPFNINTY